MTRPLPKNVVILLSPVTPFLCEQWDYVRAQFNYKKAVIVGALIDEIFLNGNILFYIVRAIRASRLMSVLTQKIIIYKTSSIGEEAEEYFEAYEEVHLIMIDEIDRFETIATNSFVFGGVVHIFNAKEAWVELIARAFHFI
ncbi:hypothetical protein [Solibacillus sp. FSL H8-0538]|uniref:hypothetical protein n=1 Tax=Solibacillus sp. FSL H8-0538 TaxID=2921400 RepID=UPI0030FBB964